MKADFRRSTREERSVLCNGCGPQNAGWSRRFIPQFVFSSAGDEHDWDYWVGGGIDAYMRANLRFYANCLLSISRHSPLWKWPWHLLMAHVYHVCVKWGGQLSFRWGRPRTHEEMQDLARRMIEKRILEDLAKEVSR